MAMTIAGCASEAPQRRTSGIEASEQYRPGMRPVGPSSDDGLVVEHEYGALDQREVESVLDRHLGKLVACYDRAGPAQKYASGEVRLRFFVAGSGEVSQVLVVKSDLGNHSVESCLVDEARKTAFRPPGGRKATDFEYPLQFRSSGEIPVVAWDPGVLATDVAPLLPQLASCGALGAKKAHAVVYIEPGGAVGSVGLASDEPLEAAAAACVVDQIRTWRLPDDRSHVVRTTLAVAPLPPAPPPRAPAARATKRSRRSR